MAAEATREHYESLQGKCEELLRAAEAERAAPPPGAGGDAAGDDAGQPSTRQASASSRTTESFTEAVRIISVDVPRTPLPPRLSGQVRPEAEAAITRMLRAFAVEARPRV